MRGNCGGPISPDLDGVAHASIGAPARKRLDLPHLGDEFADLRTLPFIRDSEVFRDPFSVSPEDEAGRWRVCPTSEIRRVAPLVEAYRLFRLAGTMGANPSAALVEAVAILAGADLEMDAAYLEEVRRRG